MLIGRAGVPAEGRPRELSDGAADIERAIVDLSLRLPSRLAGLARLANNYRWSWMPGGPDLFAHLDGRRWDACGENPVRMLQEVSPALLDHASHDDGYVARVAAAARDLNTYVSAPPREEPLDAEHPVAFFCSEYGVHRSLPIYSGGLGVLAGDILKEASDRAVPLVAVGLLYRQGYCRQRIDRSGWQQEYWVDTDPDRLPGALVTRANRPLTVRVTLAGREVVAQIWRIDIGRVPLYLLDTDIPDNHPVDRWIANRLYVGEHRMRLSQYALLGIGGLRALRTMGIEPGILHLNEGHPAMAPLEMARAAVSAGAPLDRALAEARGHTVFTTHTPVAAGNEAYGPGEILEVLGNFHEQLGTDVSGLLELGRVRHGDLSEPFGITPLALRLSAAANGVSQRHGQVARDMWADLDIPIGHVTNGVHVPTWMAPPMRDLLDRHLGKGWQANAADPRTWAPVAKIPDAEIWGVREQLRAGLIEAVRLRVVADRLSRGEPAHLADRAAQVFDPELLVVGLARRLATYKRTALIVRDRHRLLHLLSSDRPIQLLVAGKAHPSDDGGKRVGQEIMETQAGPDSTGRLVFLADYDMGLAAHLTAGADIWLNVPRPPLEASGTSGMKSAMNGGLNLSVLDGWWEEGYNGENGWGIASGGDDAYAQDERDADALYGLLESEVVPLFYDRDEQGIPTGLVRRIKASLMSVGPQFSATRMVLDYLERYRGVREAQDGARRP
jgi:starch phosphorylase